MTTPVISPVRPSLTRGDDPLWRVTHSDGKLLGYVDAQPQADGLRYRARRLVSPAPRFQDLGEFWRFEDAVGCFVA